jgi:NadR type nicotinamide-nucleotide adenylyltransferase
MLKKIAILGPESTGKSQLARELATHYKTVFVPEYAREYLNTFGSDYIQDDLLKIAKQQFKNTIDFQKQANNFLFTDTELLVLKIWSEVKYKKVDSWILENLKKQDFDLYLLTDIDLAWEYDPLREHPNERSFLLKLYEKELQKLKFPWVKISGQGIQRTQNAIQAIANFFAEN